MSRYTDFGVSSAGHPRCWWRRVGRGSRGSRTTPRCSWRAPPPAGASRTPTSARRFGSRSSCWAARTGERAGTPPRRSWWSRTAALQRGGAMAVLLFALEQQWLFTSFFLIFFLNVFLNFFLIIIFFSYMVIIIYHVFSFAWHRYWHTDVWVEAAFKKISEGGLIMRNEWLV